MNIIRRDWQPARPIIGPISCQVSSHGWRLRHLRHANWLNIAIGGVSYWSGRTAARSLSDCKGTNYVILCIVIITGPPIQNVGARTVVCRRLSSVTRRICNVTHQEQHAAGQSCYVPLGRNLVPRCEQHCIAVLTIYSRLLYTNGFQLQQVRCGLGRGIETGLYQPHFYWAWIKNQRTVLSRRVADAGAATSDPQHCWRHVRLPARQCTQHIALTMQSSFCAMR